MILFSLAASGSAILVGVIAYYTQVYTPEQLADSEVAI